jgi:hypothetical protein
MLRNMPKTVKLLSLVRPGVPHCASSSHYHRSVTGAPYPPGYEVSEEETDRQGSARPMAHVTRFGAAAVPAMKEVYNRVAWPILDAIYPLIEPVPTDDYLRSQYVYSGPRVSELGKGSYKASGARVVGKALGAVATGLDMYRGAKAPEEAARDFQWDPVVSSLSPGRAVGAAGRYLYDIAKQLRESGKGKSALRKTLDAGSVVGEGLKSFWKGN